MYTGSVWMGYDKSEVDKIVYDTGSDTFVLETSDCWWCNEVYDINNSRTYEPLLDTNEAVEYGDGTAV